MSIAVGIISAAIAIGSAIASGVAQKKQNERLMKSNAETFNLNRKQALKKNKLANESAFANLRIDKRNTDMAKRALDMKEMNKL